MDKKIFLFLIRHGESEANASDHFLHTDPELTDKGLLQARRTSVMIKKCFVGMKFKVFVSVLARAQETALTMFPSHVIIVGHHLKENSYMLSDIPSGENFPIREIVTQRKKIKTRLGFNPSALRYQDTAVVGKKYTDEAIMRGGDINMFLRKNMNHMRDGDIVFIVCHGGIMRSFMKRHEPMPNCAVYHAYNTPDSMISLECLENDVQSEMIYFPSVV